MADDEKLGSGNTVVLIDCTYITKKKKNRGGFRGKSTDGHSTCIVGMYELDLSQSPRVGTGRVVLKVVSGEQKEIMKKLIPKYCVAGAEIWTDSAKAYAWLHEGHEEQGVLSRVSGFVHSWIKHCDGKFARDEISTNGVEALFSRVKKVPPDCPAHEGHQENLRRLLSRIPLEGEVLVRSRVRECMLAQTRFLASLRRVGSDKQTKAPRTSWSGHFEGGQGGRKGVQKVAASLRASCRSRGALHSSSAPSAASSGGRSSDGF